MDDGSRIAPPAGLRQFQRFGDAGPAYEVLGWGKKPGHVRIHVFDSGEECDYPIEHAKDDPAA